MLIDKYIHPKLKVDPNLTRRARFMIMYVIIGGGLALIMGIYNVAIKGLNTNTIILLISCVFTLLVIKFVEKTGNMDIPAFILCFFIWAASVSSAWGHGGVYSMDLHPLLNVPMAAFIFKGRKYALYWAAVIALTFIGFALADYLMDHDFRADVENLSKEGYYMKRLMYAINIAALVIFYEYSMKQQTKELIDKTNMEKVRQQIAKDFHDEMGNKLASITLNSNLLKLSNTTDEKTRETLNKIESTSSSLYQSSRDFIWAIDAKSDELEQVFDYIKDFGEDFCQTVNIAFYTATIPSSLPHLVLPPFYGRHIIMLFKEVMTNAAKYAQCKRIDFSLTVKNNEIIFEVKDDGKGFDTTQKSKGRGLNNMQHRAKQMGGILVVHSEAEKGTHVKLSIKL